jgi:hypothetical protein
LPFNRRAGSIEKKSSSRQQDHADLDYDNAMAVSALIHRPGLAYRSIM